MPPSLSLMESLNCYGLLPKSSATCSQHVYTFVVRPVLVCLLITCPFLVCLLIVSSFFVCSGIVCPVLVSLLIARSFLVCLFLVRSTVESESRTVANSITVFSVNVGLHVVCKFTTSCFLVCWSFVLSTIESHTVTNSLLVLTKARCWGMSSGRLLSCSLCSPGPLTWFSEQLSIKDLCSCWGRNKLLVLSYKECMLRQRKALTSGNNTGHQSTITTWPTRHVKYVAVL